MRPNYKLTVTSCFIGYVVLAIVNNFVPLLFVTLQSEYGVSLSQITLLVTVNFSIQLLSDLFSAHGPDSFLGYTASVLLGASETIFYTLALYYGSIGVRRTRFTVPVALLATLVSVVTGILFSRLLY